MENINKLDTSWKNINRIVIVGYGRQAQKLIPFLDQKFEIVEVWDNDTKKHGDRICIRNKVLSVRPYKDLKLDKDIKIIVCALGGNYAQISNQLNSIGYIEGVDFLQHENFITNWYWEYLKNVNMLKLDIFVTSFCNLKCEKCASFIPYWKKYINVDSNYIFESIDRYFNYVDYVTDIDILGGEPLLYPYLEAVIEYLGQNYRDRIGYLGIITNGLIIPSDCLLYCCKTYNVTFSISDYSSTLGKETKRKIDLFCEQLNKKNIAYLRNREIKWKDLCFPHGGFRVEDKYSNQHRNACNNTCHNLYDRKLYFCSAAMTAELSGLTECSENDYFLLNSDFPTEKEKALLIEWSNGNLSCKYSGFCDVCAGYGDDNRKTIKAAVQARK